MHPSALLAPPQLCLTSHAPAPQTHRYDAVKQELVNDDLGVAWPVVDGVPHLIPQQGRILDPDEAEESRLGPRDLLLH
jgi:uncharacterized protein YbaR (Trm112 family)